jgi:hypothetical protein
MTASACPIADNKSTNLAGPAPISTGTYTVNPPQARTPKCNVTSSTTVIEGTQPDGSTNVTTTQYPSDPCVLGFKWEGDWVAGKSYKKQTCFINPNGSVVQYQGSSWLCILDHTSSEADKPTIETPTPPAVNGNTYWELMSEGQKAIDEAKTLAEANKSWWDKITDWVKDMDIWDWLKVAAIAGGLIYYGLKLLDAMDADGKGNGNADKRYNGSPGFVPTYSKPTLADVLTGLCSYGGITADISLIDPTETIEFTLAATTSIRTVLQQLSIAFNFDMVNSGGVLKFVPRSTVLNDTLYLSDMGYSANAVPPSPYVGKRYQGISLPRKVNITYFSPALDGNNYTQTAELFTYPEGNELTITVPITLTDLQARKVAEISLINAHLERMNYKFTTSYKFIHLEPGDCVDSPMGIVRITKINEGDEGLLQFEACDAGEPNLSTISDLSFSVPPSTGNSDATLGYSASYFIDPPWTGTEDTGIRLYSVTHGYGKEHWPGAMIYVSRDGGNNYSPLITVNEETTWGIAQATLGTPIIATSGPNTGFDVTNTLSVKLKTGSLISVTDAELEAGANKLYVGQELISFGVATLTAPNTYTLSRLKRGLSGTNGFTSSHQGDELVTLYSTLVRIPLEESDYGKTLHFKTVTFGSSLDVADEDVVTVMSNNNKLFAPKNGQAVRQADMSWVISWSEDIRSPDVVNNSASTLTQVDSDQSGWGVAIVNMSTGNVVSSRPCGYKTYTYTAAEQINDFGSTQTHIRAVIVPMHKKYGGGYPLTINT